MLYDTTISDPPILFRRALPFCFNTFKNYNWKFAKL